MTLLMCEYGLFISMSVCCHYFYLCLSLCLSGYLPVSLSTYTLALPLYGYLHYILLSSSVTDTLLFPDIFAVRLPALIHSGHVDISLAFPSLPRHKLKYLLASHCTN